MTETPLVSCHTLHSLPDTLPGGVTLADVASGMTPANILKSELHIDVNLSLLYEDRF